MSSMFANEAVVASVYFDAASTSATGLGAGGTVVDEAGTVIASLSVGGLLRWMPSRCGSVMLADGAVVRGFQPIDSLGADMVDADIDAIVQPATSRRLAMLMMHGPLGGSFTVTHQDPSVTASQRATGPYASDIVYGADRVQVFCETRGGGRLWRVPDWSGYLPSVPSNWNGAPARITTWAAFDELAARAPRVSSGTTAITNAVPAVMWSATVAEGTLIGGRLTIHGAVDNGGTIEDSFVVAVFTARRSVGGAPTVTVVSADEQGTFGAGSVGVAVNGNDIEVALTYADSGTLTWTIVDETRVVTP